MSVPADLHAALGDEGARWNVEHPPEAGAAVVPPSGAGSAASSEPSTATANPSPQQPTAAASEPKETPRPKVATAPSRQAAAEKWAHLGWTIADVFAVKFLGPRVKLDAAEKAMLKEATAPVILKHWPETSELSEEEILIGTVGLVYGSKFVPEIGALFGGTPPGGTDAPRSESTAEEKATPTTASVDGKNVKAEVLS